MKRLALLILLTGMITLAAPKPSEAEVCTGEFVNPITDICWDCIFPVSIGPISVFGDRPDPPNPGNILCACPITIPPFVRIGITIGFWELARLVDVTKRPYCFVNLGGLELDAGIGTGQTKTKSRGGQTHNASWHLHWYIYPVYAILELFADSICMSDTSFDIAYEGASRPESGYSHGQMYDDAEARALWGTGQDGCHVINRPVSRNPVVHLALNQIRHTVNAVIRQYGLPDSIHIELARDLNKSAEARDEAAKLNEKNRKASDEAARELEKIEVTVSRLNIQKYKLWKEQGCACVYTGEALSLGDLYSGKVDVDHILPRSKTYLDSLANKVVCLRSANADKNNRAPYDVFANDNNYDWDLIMRMADKLPNNKKWRFEADAMKNFEEDPEAYRARYGTDNSYIARVARQYLACLFGQPQNVVAVSSYIVSLLRGKWGLTKILGRKDGGKKSRDDHRHHFIDALTAACATRGMVQSIQREAARCEKAGLDDFVDTIAPPFGKPKEFVNAAREATLERVSLSRKANHSTAGQLHEDTFFGIIDGPDKNGSYVCRKRKKLADYNTLQKLEKPKIKNTLPDIPEIEKARDNLEAIKDSVRNFITQATRELEEERNADKASGKKGRAVSEMAVFSRAVQFHKDAGGKTQFTLYEKNKLVNIRRAGDGKEAGIEDFRFHDLRHSTASYLAMQGANALEIADMLGHKTLQMVKRYSHLSESHTRGLAKNLSEKIF